MTNNTEAIKLKVGMKVKLFDFKTAKEILIEHKVEKVSRNLKNMIYGISKSDYEKMADGKYYKIISVNLNSVNLDFSNLFLNNYNIPKLAIESIDPETIK